MRVVQQVVKVVAQEVVAMGALVALDVTTVGEHVVQVVPIHVLHVPATVPVVLVVEAAMDHAIKGATLAVIQVAIMHVDLVTVVVHVEVVTQLAQQDATQHVTQVHTQ